MLETQLPNLTVNLLKKLMHFKTMKKIFLFSIFLFTISKLTAQETPFEISKGERTATYQECIAYYKLLDQKYEEAKMLSYGLTDSGKPLNLFVLSKEKVFEVQKIKALKKVVLLINNGIHPGEPEGIDASMALARNLLQNKTIPKNVIVCIIPIYNIGGALNRGSYSRANQNGPETYGFRGNAKNLDLNRDFIKTDSKNSYAFQKLFNIWNPDVFVDTHVSNGADYQYTMTLIETQKDKLNGTLSKYMTSNLVPYLYQEMKNSGFEMTPYVDHIKETPDDGIIGFLETPRFATGYTTLHNTIGFITETHMLKPFAKREASTYAFLDHILKKTNEDAQEIINLKQKADEEISKQQSFPISWTLDKKDSVLIDFKGYTAERKPSEVSGQNRLFYNRELPFTKKIAQFNHFIPSQTIEKPVAYMIPQAWDRVIDLLKLNSVSIKTLKKDTTINVEAYYIVDYKTGTRPYEGHYLHSGVQIKKELMPIKYYSGDVVVYTNQKTNRYIIETLEPQATDSFFAWNFFDSILGQKEYFSAYVFEDLAADLLKNNPKLKAQFEAAKQADTKLSQSGSAQLNWIYQHSEHYEKTYLRYPVTRILTNTQLELD
jgi:hypothetical protein